MSGGAPPPAAERWPDSRGPSAAGPGASDETSAAWGREMEAALTQAGFSEVRLETMALKPAVVCALGVNRGDA